MKGRVAHRRRAANVVYSPNAGFAPGVFVSCITPDSLLQYVIDRRDSRRFVFVMKSTVVYTSDSLSARQSSLPQRLRITDEK
jgi:hypothetical protein